MGRNFQSADTAKVDLGDITACRFEWDQVWTALLFFRIEDTQGDDRGLLAKTGSSSSNGQFFIRVDAGSEPQEIEVLGKGWSILFNGGSNVYEDTWYLVAVSCDGGGESNTLTLHLLAMDGTVLDNGVTGAFTSQTTDFTYPIYIAGREGTSDEMDGDVAFAATVGKELSLDEIKSYLRDPVGAVLGWKAQGTTIHFFLPLGLGSTEPDWSGQGNNGTLVNSSSPGENPPVVRLATRRSFGIPHAPAGAPPAGDFVREYYNRFLAGAA